MTLGSVAVVLVVVLAVFSPPGETLALYVETSAIASDEAVIYGVVEDATGKRLRGATVVVVRENGEGPEQIASVETGTQGTFRVVVTERFGMHRVVVSADAGARTARDSIRIDVEPGSAYGITAELVQRDYFVFLPVSTY